ncbi:glutamate--tRNA ligase [Fibrobacterota bacterium]
MDDTNIRVRFAPSPTGTLHVGGARTALFNWLFARSKGGAFILRIEDTDQSRYDRKAEEAMIKDLKWMGLEWDEGPDRDGGYGPYRQSLRLEQYQKYARQLVEKGCAYYCFCTPERMKTVRAEQQAMKQKSGYDRHCRDVSPEEVSGKLSEGTPHVIRLKVPLEGTTVFTDYLRRDIEYQNGELDDLVLIKSDGFPAYHLANVVDDHLMEISHVLRGDEWIPSTPKHALIYRAFGWQPPVFAHLPVILAEGGGKLSKRKGASSVTDYKDMGFLPGALVNFLALLGWNPGNDVELMDRQRLVDAFSLERINPKSCAFDEKKLEWMNGQYIIQSAPEELLAAVKDRFTAAGVSLGEFSDGYVLSVIMLMKERARRLTDFVNNGRYFFEDPSAYDSKAEKKHFKEETAEVLESLKARLASAEPFDASSLEDLYKITAGERGLPNSAKLIHPTRLAISGLSFGPGLFELMELLSREVVIRRMSRAVEYLKNRRTQA